jgi:hypothetical protein
MLPDEQLDALQERFGRFASETVGRSALDERFSRDLARRPEGAALLVEAPPLQRRPSLLHARDLAVLSFEGPFVPPFPALNVLTSVPAPTDDHFLLGATVRRGSRRHDRLLARAHPHGAWLEWPGAASARRTRRAPAAHLPFGSER